MTQASERLHAQAVGLATTGKLKEALPIWGEALRQDPHDVAVLIGLGNALASVAEFDKAKELAESAARLRPQSHAPWLLLGQVSMAMGDAQQALEALLLACQRADTADDAADDVAACKTALARAYAATGHYQEAKDAVRDVNTADALIITAHAHHESGDAHAAMAALHRAGELDPMHPEVFKRLAVLTAETDVTLARELARHALDLSPADAEAKALVDALGL